jgi:hypothetical protein
MNVIKLHKYEYIMILKIKDKKIFYAHKKTNSMV